MSKFTDLVEAELLKVSRTSYSHSQSASIPRLELSQPQEPEGQSNGIEGWLGDSLHDVGNNGKTRTNRRNRS